MRDNVGLRVSLRKAGWRRGHNLNDLTRRVGLDEQRWGEYGHLSEDVIEGWTSRCQSGGKQSRYLVDTIDEERKWLKSQ